MIRHLHGLVAAAIGLGLTAGCDGQSHPSSPTPPPPPALRLVGLDIGGPDSVVPGGTAQLTAAARLSDGSTRNVTNEAVWQSHNEAVLSVGPTGLLSAADTRGEANVTVRYSGLPEAVPGTGFSTRDILVLPAGTFRIYGSLRDGGVLVSGVRIEVTGGPAVGLSVVGNGFYRLYGVWGDTEIRASKDGYGPIVRRLEVTRHETVDFELTPLRPREDVTGTYRFAATADAACRDALPEETRQRTYTAVVTQDGARVSVELEGARFVVDGQGTGNGFSGAVEPGLVGFSLAGPWLDEYGLSYPSVFEELSPGTYLAIFGTATVTASAGGYAGALHGSFQVFRWDGRLSLQTVGECTSSSHRLAFER